MPGINLTGAPNTRDYVLGRGVIRFAKNNPLTGLPDVNGFRDLGNAPAFTVTQTTEDLKHQNSRSCLKFTDKRFVLSQEVGLSFQLDETRNFENLAMFLSGTVSIYDNAHDTAFVDAIQVSAVKKGNWYEMRNATGERIYDLTAAGMVYTIEKGPAPGTVMVLGVDYEVDASMGLFRVIPASVVAVDGDSIIMTITTPATTPNDLDQVNALLVSEVTGTLLFVQDNAGDCGTKVEWRFHQVSLSPDGELPMIGDEVSVMSFVGIAQVNSFITDPSQVLTVRTL